MTIFNKGWCLDTQSRVHKELFGTYLEQELCLEVAVATKFSKIISGGLNQHFRDKLPFPASGF
jgi:hypothetical protein